MQAHLLFADGAILVPPVAQDVRIGARVSAQTGLASLVEQIENDQSGDPHDDAKAPSDYAVHVS